MYDEPNLRAMDHECHDTEKRHLCYGVVRGTFAALSLFVLFCDMRKIESVNYDRLLAL